jgi:hypothetical protein
MMASTSEISRPSRNVIKRLAPIPKHLRAT